jgi:hypothetical protein
MPIKALPQPKSEGFIPIFMLIRQKKDFIAIKQCILDTNAVKQLF